MNAETMRVDVLVVGAGIGGLAAASEAARGGALVGVVEKLADIGGSAALSAGIIWTARNYREIRERMPAGDSALQQVMIDDFPAAIEAVRTTGVEVSREVDGPYFGFGTGHQVDIVGLLRRWTRGVEAAGGWVVPRTPARRLLTDDAGAVIGALVEGPDGVVEVEADAVVLASGGIVGDPQLVASFVGTNADQALVRANPGSVGDGFRMAQAVGAAASRSLSSFYGHLVSYPILDWDERHFLPLTQYHSIHSILVNRLGRRFIDESLGDEFSNQALLGQPEGRAILLADDETRRRYVVTAPFPYGEVVDRFAAAAAAGGHYVVADSVEGLIEAVSAWGIPAPNLRATLDAYHRSAAGQSAILDAPMPTTAAPLLAPPFHAVEVQPALTLMYGGIRIDAAARVLDRDNRPIRGLYAAGADAGGVYHAGYGGGLALGLVFGRTAARTVLTEIPGAK
jgi:succinate dehydrogenase/fumarate reductase flavoprotein subunit